MTLARTLGTHFESERGHPHAGPYVDDGTESNPRSFSGLEITPRTWATNFGIVVLGYGCATALALSSTILLTKLVEKAEFGLFSAFVSLVMIFSIIMDLGMTQSLTRHISRIESGQDKKCVYSAIYSVVTTKLLLGFILGTCATGLLFITSIGRQMHENGILFLIPVGGFTVSFFSLLQSIFQAQRSYRTVGGMLVIRSAIFFFLITAIFMANHANLMAATLAYVVSFAPLAAAWRGVIQQKLSEAPKGLRMDWKLVRFLMSFGRWIAVGALFFGVFEQMPVIIAVELFGPEWAAELSVALSITGMIGLFNVPLMLIVVPELSRIRTSTDFWRYLTTIYKPLLLVSIMVGGGLYVARNDAVAILYGDRYSSASFLLGMLVLPYTLAFAMRPLTTSVTFLFGYPAIGALVSTAQLLLCLGIAATFSAGKSIAVFVALYSMIHIAGTMFMTSMAVLFAFRRQKRLAV